MSTSGDLGAKLGDLFKKSAAKKGRRKQDEDEDEE
jgi:hypothetical protein